MKEVYKSAGLKVADYIKLDTLDEALEFTKKEWLSSDCKAR